MRSEQVCEEKWKGELGSIERKEGKMKRGLVSKWVVGSMLACVALFVFQGEALAGVTGKIAGTIKDAETGEPLPGANVVIVGTRMGAAADVDGDYFIMNIPPGTYAVEASMMGYRSVSKTEVIVSVDHTTTVDFTIEPTVIKMPGVTVTAGREIISMDVSATQTKLPSAAIEAMPISKVDEMLAMQAGSWISYDLDEGTGLAIRGGGIGESDFQVDGISLKSELTDVSHMTLPKSSIKEVQLLTGGFNAEYGGVRSGLVNTITKEGSPGKYTGSLELRYSPPGRKHFGPDAYDKNGRIWQVFAGPKAFEGVPEDDVELFRRTKGDSGYAFPFKGWNAIAAELAADDDPTNDLTPQQALELWKLRHKPRSYADEPDYDIDASFGGPLLPKTTFFASYRHENSQLVYPLSRKNEVNDSYQLKLTTRFTPALKLRIEGIYGKRSSCTPACFGSSFGVLSDNAWGPVAGTVSGSRFATEFAADAFTSYGSHRSMYVRAWWPTKDDKLFRGRLKLTHVLSPSTYYELQYQYGKGWIDVWHLPPRDTTKIHQIGDKWYDETPEGWSTVERYDIPHMFMMSGGARYSNKSSNWSHQLKYDIVSQVNKYNQVKAGFSSSFPYYKVRSCYYTSADTALYRYEDRPELWQWWDANPTSGSAYIQDKLEFKGMIANFGLRADYLDPKSKAYELVIPYDPYYARKNFPDDVWFRSKQTEPGKARLKLQPRLGISHPVSAYGKIYFNYGHFYQPPTPYHMYSKGLAESGPGFLMPTPNLDWPRTIAYEAGYEQNIANMFLIHVAGYYKDITGQFMLTSGIDWDHTVENQYWTNNNYADIRGIELRFNKPWGDFLTFWSNYNYMVTSYGYTALPNIYENPMEAEAQAANAEQIKPHAAPDFRTGIDLHTPKDWGPILLGAKPFAGIRLSLLYMWEAGGEWVFNPEAPREKQHWIKSVDYSNADLKVEKSISLGSIHGVVFMDVYNLFNQKYLYTGGWTTAEYQSYRSSLHLPWETGDQKGNDRWGDYPHNGKKEYIDIGWHNWMQFLNPRDIFFGIRFEF